MSDTHSDRRTVLTCASRGRNDGWIQHLEIGGGIANCLTNVAKDSYVMEIIR